MGRLKQDKGVGSKKKTPGQARSRGAGGKKDKAVAQGVSFQTRAGEAHPCAHQGKANYPDFLFQVGSVN